MLLLHYLVNFFWGGLAPGHSLGAPAAAGSSKRSWVQPTFDHCLVRHQDPPAEGQNGSKLQSFRSKGLGKAVPLLEGHWVETVEATWSQKTPKMVTFAGAGTRSLSMKAGARCVL